MGVKDLVGFFEPPATALGTPTRSESQSGRRKPTATLTSATRIVPYAPGPAHFIQHQTRQVFPHNNDEHDGLPFARNGDFVTSSDDPSIEFTADVTDEYHRPGNATTLLSSISNNVQTKSSLIRRHASGHEADTPESDTQFLLSKGNHTYPQDGNAIVASSSFDHKHTILPPPKQVKARIISPHSPIPAVTIFSRKAATLFLPKLDDYLAALPLPHPPPLPSTNRGKDEDIGIFPPMDRLLSSGRSLEDLETNSGIPPSWRNRKTILGGLANLLLGIMVRHMFSFLPMLTYVLLASGIQRVSGLLQLTWFVQHCASFCVDIEHHW
jgi:hypothetical protein